MTTQPVPTTPNGNGTQLPPAREAVVEQGNRIFQEVAAERDDLLRKLRQRDTDIALLEVKVEGKEARITELESRVASAYAVRDEMVARAERRLAALMAVNSLMLTFEIPAAPLVRERDDTEYPHSRRCVMGNIVERLRKDATEWHANSQTGDMLREAADEIERLREVIRQRTKLLDDQLGTPCEQVRHEQEVENLKAEIERLRGAPFDESRR